MANVQSYSSKSVAIRGAKRAGMENPVAYQGEDNRWYISDAGEVLGKAGEVLGKADDFEASAEELAKQTVRPTADEELNIETRPMIEEEVDATAKLAAMHAQVDELKATTEETAEDRLRAATNNDFAGNKGVQNAAREIAKTKSYKQVAHYGKSTVDKPVGFIHQFLSDNPGMTRKEAVIALTEGYGVNYSTARTQYQRWYSANKKAK